MTNIGAGQKHSTPNTALSQPLSHAQKVEVVELVALELERRAAALKARREKVWTVLGTIAMIAVMATIIWYAYQGVLANLDGRIYP